MRARTVSLLLVVVLAGYFLLLGKRAWELLADPRPASIGLGIGLLVLPVIGVWLVVTTLRFGMRTDKLARRLAVDGGVPDTSTLPRRPSGRIDLDAVDAWIDERRAEVEADPENWRCWFRLAHGYDVAGDRRRAREAMRQAHDLAEVEL